MLRIAQHKSAGSKKHRANSTPKRKGTAVSVDALSRLVMRNRDDFRATTDALQLRRPILFRRQHFSSHHSCGIRTLYDGMIAHKLGARRGRIARGVGVD